MRIGTCATAMAVALLGTMVAAQRVNYDFDRTADFSRYRTYSWVRGTNVNDELNHNRIVRAVDAQLAAKGFTRVEGEHNADVLVAYHASFDENLEITGFRSGFGGPRFANVSGTATTHKILTGTLVVDMMDAKTRNIVWRGFAERDLDQGAKPEKRVMNLNKATEKIFKNYPPKP